MNHRDAAFELGLDLGSQEVGKLSLPASRPAGRSAAGKRCRDQASRSK